MQKINFMDAMANTSPKSVSVICTSAPDGTTNLTPVAWWTYLESEPPMIGFSMSKESYGGELVADTGKAVLSIPGAAIADAVFECGNVSGRDVNKAEKFGIALVDAPIKYPVHSRLAFICSLENKAIVGDCIFYICKVDDIFLNENERQLFIWGGSKKLGPIDLRLA